MGLKIYLLGQFRIQANEKQVELPSRPAQALLAYLALNAGTSHRREKLAGLLWPDSTDSNARSYLRQALWRIRKSLGSGSISWEELLQISDISVTLDNQADYWLDAESLRKKEEPRSIDELVEAVRLYKGELLPGFYEDWVLVERDRLQAAYHQNMTLLIDKLTHSRQWDDLIHWSEEWIRLGHSPEPAYRGLMKAYAGRGDQGMASATYQRCLEALDRELGLDPSPSTRMLYEQILRGTYEESSSPVVRSEISADQMPSFLSDNVLERMEMPTFVARKAELGQLLDYLALALDGQSRVAFITGEAGSGKTALIQEFTRIAHEQQDGLVVAGGNCNAYTGIGDPYLPFREILEMLTGDVEAKWTAGAVSGEHARRLWSMLPVAIHALAESGQGLVGTFIPRTALLERAAAYSQLAGREEWMKWLEDLDERKSTSNGNVINLQQGDLFEQYTRVLQALAKQKPLLLVVDDLQWADLGSISLLFHMGRHLVGSRILIVGAYRPEEVAIGRDGERHPLAPVISEFQRSFGEILVNVDQAERRGFVEELLDSEPNHFSDSFRQMLYRQTRGHALSTTELLRGMQERGDLVQDRNGMWIVGPALDWETLPARVEAAIAERIGRLAEPLQALLRVASVEGEEFTAEVAARVLGIDRRAVVQSLSRELDQRHRLIRAQSIERPGSRRVSRYRFRNYLFQKYLYDHLDDVERAYIHEDVGTMLEELFGDQADEIAVHLAWHFQEARIAEKAIHYLCKAGERAAHLSAYQEGITHLSRGLALLKALPDSPERAQQELALHLAFGIVWQGAKGARSSERKEAYTRAYELSQQLNKTTQLCQVLGERVEFFYVGAEYDSARELGKEALNVAQEAGDPYLVALGYWYLGFTSFAVGEFTQARDYLEKVYAAYEPQTHHHRFVVLRGKDAGVGALAYDACCQWCLGYPDLALKRSRDSLDLARELKHPFSMADVLCFGSCLFYRLLGDAEAMMEGAEELIKITIDRVPAWLGTGISYRGEALVMMGRLQEGIEEIQKGLASRQTVEAQCYNSGTLGTLASAQAQIGRPEEGLATLIEALTLVKETNERYFEAELYRVKGEIMHQLGDEAEAEASFAEAITVARNQQAKSWELRACVSLARLWQRQHKNSEALRMLIAIYGWFEEGFDTPDLIGAKRLLEDLS